MKTLKGPRTPELFAARLRRLKGKRREQHLRARAEKNRRQVLTSRQRATVLAATNRRCHICGGKITPSSSWQADHVLAHSGGGRHSLDNYLPAHSLCNNYRWDYLAEEFQWILKLGVWTADQIRKETKVGADIAERFIKKEVHRRARRRS